MAQAGYLLPRQPIEIAGRYGLNRRIGRNRIDILDRAQRSRWWHWLLAWPAPFKVQADVFRSWNEADGQELGQTTSECNYKPLFRADPLSPELTGNKTHRSFVTSASSTDRSYVLFESQENPNA